MPTRYSFGGDEHLFAEIDEVMSLEAFFKSLALARVVRESNIKGVTEICPSNASMQVRFDPDQIAPDDLLAEVRSLEAAGEKAASQLETRIIEIPVYYNDPWTHETLMRFRERHQDPSITDLEYAAKTNGYADVPAFVPLIRGRRGSYRWSDLWPVCHSSTKWSSGSTKSRCQNTFVHAQIHQG
jgi:urea carboxylase